MSKEQSQYLELPTQAALELLRANKEGKAVIEAIYGYLKEKKRKRPSFAAQERGRGSEKDWLDSCMSQLFEFQTSNAPLSESIDMAADLLKNISKKDFNKSYHGDKAKIYQSENEHSLSFVDSGVVSPDEAESFHLVNYFEPFVQFLNRIDEYAQVSGNTGIKEPLNDLRNYLGKKLPETFQKLKAGIISIYAIAKKEGIDYRRLLYTLRKVGFPLDKLKANREFYFVFPDQKPLFDIVYNRIRFIWEREDNYRAWTKAFLSVGWSKARTSQFMRRKIQSGLLPNWFFDYLPVDNVMVYRLIRNDPTLVGLIKLEKMMPVFKPRKELMRELKANITKAKKSILDEAK